MSKAKKQRRRGFKPTSKSSTVIDWLVVLQRVTAALFIFILPILIYTNNSEYGYTKTIFAYLMITILYALWGGQAWLEKRLTFWRPAMFWPALGLILAGALSIVNASSPGIVLQSLAVLTYFILFYFYIANTTNRETFYLYLSVGAVSTVFTAVYGMMQYYAWLPGLVSKGGEHDMLSSFGNKNFLAEFLNLWMLPLLVLLVRAKLLWLKILVLVVTFINFVVFINADSTGALMGFLAGVFFFGIGFIVFKKFTAQSLVRRQAWVWVGAWVVVVIVSWFIADQPGFFRDIFADESTATEALAFEKTVKVMNAFQGPFDQIREVLDSYWQEGSGNTRAWDWWVAYEMWRANPIFGVGLGHYKVQFINYKINFLATERGQQFDFYIPRAAQAHNDYFQAAAEMGSVGIAAMIFAMIMLFWKTIQQVFSVKGSQKWVVLALYAGVVAFFVDAMVNFPGHLAASSFSMLMFLGMLHSNYLFPKMKAFRLKKLGTQIAVVVFLVSALSVMVLAYRDWQANIHLDAGIRHANQGRYQLALGEFEKSLALDFQPAEVLFRLGAAHQALGNPDEAAKYFEQTMDSYLVDEVFLPLAVYKLNNQQYDEARALLDQLVASKPRDSLMQEAELFRAVIEVRDGNLVEGVTLLQAMVEKYPDFERAHYTLGDALMAAGDCFTALRHYEKSLEISIKFRDSFQKQMDNLQGQTVLAQTFSRIRSSLERYINLTEEIQETVNRVRAQCG